MPKAKPSRIKQQVPAAAGKPAPIAVAGLPDPFKTAKIVLFLLGVLLYIQTAGYDYALDDKLAITENNFVVKGFKGIPDILTTDFMTGFLGEKQVVAGGRYRPLSLVMFAVEYQLFGVSPAIGHLINIFLYGLTGVLLFQVLVKIFPVGGTQRWYLTLPFVVAALFLAHPLHTEVVANIKSRDEIMSFLFGLLSLYFCIRYSEIKERSRLLYSGLALFTGLLFKESAVVFAGIIPLTLYFFTDSTIKAILKITAPALTGAFAYFSIRYAVLGGAHLDPPPELMNDPFLYASSSEKYATIFYTMGLYLKLLFFPHPLTHDYYPFQVPIISWSDVRALIPAAIYLSLLIYSLATFRKKSIVSYCILFFLGSFLLFSNLLFPIGTFMNERFMYIPSLAFCILAGYFILRIPGYIRKPSSLSTFLFFIVLMMYSVKTISRNSAWKDDFTLALTDVKTSSNSARANMAAGAELVNKAAEINNVQEKKELLNNALAYLNHALELYPGYAEAMVVAGNAWYELGDYHKSINYFEKVLQVNPYGSTGQVSYKNLRALGHLATEKGNYDAALKSYSTLLQFDSTNAEAYAKIGEIYGKYLNDLNTATRYLEKAGALEPANTDILQKRGVVYAMMNEKQKALHVFLKADSLEPNNAFILLNVGIAYNSLGEEEKAKACFERAFQINPSLRNAQK